jgi:hypothetical protein
MKKTAVEWLQERISIGLTYEQEVLFEGLFDQAKEIEKKEKLKHQLFIGKVAEIFGFDKTLELLKECKNEIL